MKANTNHIFHSKKKLFIVVLFMLFAIAPLFIKSNYIIGVIILCYVFASFGIAWNMIGGYGGQISWCHSAFAAVGAYTGFICFKNFGISPILTLPIGILISFGLSTLIGTVTFRYRGPFFAISTIALAELLRVLLQFSTGITGGSSGMNIRYNGQDAWNLIFSTNIPFYYIMLMLLVIIIIAMAKFEKSKIGYYLNAIKGDEDAAISLGINTQRVKLRAFQISAIITSIVGTVFGFFLMFIDPQSICGLDLSVKIGAVAILGGLGTLWGPVIGAFIIIPIIEISSVLLGASGGTQLLYGLSLMLVMIFRPTGVITMFNKARKVQLTKKTGDDDKSDEGGSKREYIA